LETQSSFVVDVHRLLVAAFFGCLAIELLLVLLDATVNYLHGSGSPAIRRLFNITREDGLASWFGVTQTFVVSLVLWVIFLVVRKVQGSRSQRVGWLILALFFSYMTIDDGAKIHERLGTAFKSSYDLVDPSVTDVGVAGSILHAYPSYAWQIVFAPFLIAMAIFLFYFLWKAMPRRIDHVRIVLALSCLVTAVGLDFVEGVTGGYNWITEHTGAGEIAIGHFSKSLEEFLEMLGMTIFLVTFLDYLMHINNSLSVRFLSSRTTSP